MGGEILRTTVKETGKLIALVIVNTITKKLSLILLILSIKNINVLIINIINDNTTNHCQRMTLPSLSPVAKMLLMKL